MLVPFMATDGSEHNIHCRCNNYVARLFCFDAQCAQPKLGNKKHAYAPNYTLEAVSEAVVTRREPAFCPWLPCDLRFLPPANDI